MCFDYQVFESTAAVTNQLTPKHQKQLDTFRGSISLTYFSTGFTNFL